MSVKKNNVYETIIVILNDKLNCRIIREESEILAPLSTSEQNGRHVRTSKDEGSEKCFGQN